MVDAPLPFDAEACAKLACVQRQQHRSL